MAQGPDREREREAERELGPIDYVQQAYALDDDEMFELFGIDAGTQERMLKRRPGLRAAARELESLMG